MQNFLPKVPQSPRQIEKIPLNFNGLTIDKSEHCEANISFSRISKEKDSPGLGPKARSSFILPKLINNVKDNKIFICRTPRSKKEVSITVILLNETTINFKFASKSTVLQLKKYIFDHYLQTLKV